MATEPAQYNPGVYCQSRSTKRTPSIVLSSKEITLSYEYLRDHDKKFLEHEKQQQLQPHSHDEQQHDEKHDSDKDKDNEDEEHKATEQEEEEEEEEEDDDICSITTQQSFFFHPKNYYNNNNAHHHTHMAITSKTASGSHSHGHGHKAIRSATSMMSVTSAAATVDEMEMLPNMDELHNYDKHKQLGTGTDAHVYEVVDRRDKSHVAMKLTKRKSGRYRTEIHLLHQLRTCPFIVRLLKVLEDASVYVLILEQAPMTLETLLHERCTDTPMQERVGAEIMNDVLKGIRAIHNLGFVHKDIKPENVLIFADRIHRKLQAKIADFGFATRAQAPNTFDVNVNHCIPKQTLSEFVERVADKCGTPGFWAPELVANVVELNHAFKMDVFSAGVLLYRMLCNEMPFGLFETWDLKEAGKLAKMKPNFQVVSWIQTTPKTAACSSHLHTTAKIDYIRKLAANTLSVHAVRLLRGMLRIRPHKRYTISECLKSPWFATASLK